jgi:phosphatidate cytidylyltransferase
MLKARILTALCGAALVLAALYLLPPWATTALISLLVLLGAWEWSALAPGMSSGQRVLWLLFVAALLGFMYSLAPTPASTRPVLMAALVWWFLALAWLSVAPQRIGRASVLLAALLSLVPFWLAVEVLRGETLRGASWVLFALAVVVAADTGAFFVGRALGRVKLAPQISPGKTWEGALGGLALASLVAWIGSRHFAVPAGVLVPLCLVAASLSIVGDLLESLMKRRAGVKDSGQLFPGHGGVLDRIDSLCAGVPVVALGCDLLGWLP